MIYGLFGVLEIIFLVIFAILMIVGASFDRRGAEEPKWYIFGIGLIVVVAWYWPDWTFSGVWDVVRSWTFWEPVLIYLGAGLAYSVLEFSLEVRRSARRYKAVWSNLLDRRIPVRQLDADLKPIAKDSGVQHKELCVREILQNRDNPSNNEAATNLIADFVVRNQHRYGIIKLKSTETGVEPEIDKVELAESVGAWTFFWPFYAVSLVIGDLLTEIFSTLADWMVAASRRFVRFSFSDVFKI